MSGPLHPHPDNPRYFTDHTGKAIYLTGSHTWATFQERTYSGLPPFNNHSLLIIKEK